MTKEVWGKYHNLPAEYVGKHGPRYYSVYRVLGPAGPEENMLVYGIDAVKDAIRGCWDYEVCNLNGKVIDERLLR